MATSVGGYTLNILLSLICRMIFTRYLSQEYLGINGLFSNIISMLSLTELGIGTAMVYSLYKPLAEKDTQKITAYMNAYGVAYKIIGIVIAVLGAALIPFLNFIIATPPDIPENLYVIYAFFLFSTASSYFFSYRSSLIIADQRNYVVVGISYIITFIMNVAQMISLVFFRSYMLYLTIQVISTLITNIIISKKAVKDYPYLLDKNAPKLLKSDIKRLVVDIKALTVTKLSGVLVNNTDNLVITYFNGLITTGVVSNYTLLTTTLNALMNQVLSSMTASIGNLNAISSDEHKYKTFSALNMINFWLYGWATTGLIVLSSDIVQLAFGESYVMNIGIPVILGINFYMLGMQCIVGMFKSTMGLFRYGQYILLLTATLNIIGDIILGRQYGVMGIFIATALSRLFSNTFYEPYVIYKHGFKRKFLPYVLKYLYFAVVLTISTVASYMLSTMVHFNLFASLAMKLIICIVVPNIIFFIALFKLPEFKKMSELLFRALREIKKKIKR